MTRTWSFYDEKSGALLGRTFTGSERALAMNTPDGAKPIEGRLDHLSQRIDVATGAVVDYVPPQPDADHEWSASRKRWVKRAEVAERERRSRATRARIATLELSQLRPIRELAIDPNNAEAKRRIAEIDGEIVVLRGSLER